MNALIYLYASSGRFPDWNSGDIAIDNAPIEDLREQLSEAFPWYPQDGSDDLVRSEVKDHFASLKNIIESDAEGSSLVVWNIDGASVYVVQDVDAGDYAPMSDYGVFEVAYRFPEVLNAIGLTY